MVRIRLTHFADEASAIGISVHHSAGDMASFMHLLRAWSAVARGASYAPPVVVEDRPSFFAAAMPDPVGAAPTLRHLTARELAAYEGSMAQIARDQHHFCAFFDDDEMGRLHASVEAAAGRVLSPNDALVGHMFSLIADRDAEIDRRWLAVTVNLRPRLRLPPTLLGNLLGSVNVSLERGIPPGQVAAELRRGLSRVTEDHLDYHANLRFIGEHGDSDLDRYVSTTLDPVRGSLLVTSWRGFDCYGVDFQGAVPYFYTPTGLLPYPWLAGVHEGIDNEGTLFLAMLPRRVFDRMTTPEALGSLHAFRDASRPLPERVSRLPWVR